jgi:hypothetical protein
MSMAPVLGGTVHDVVLDARRESPVLALFVSVQVAVQELNCGVCSTKCQEPPGRFLKRRSGQFVVATDKVPGPAAFLPSNPFRPWLASGHQATTRRMKSAEAGPFVGTLLAIGGGFSSG